MEFSSILFVVYFLPLFLLTYYLTPKKFRNHTFLFWSILFYSWGGPVFIGLMLLLCLANYFIVQKMVGMSKASSRKKLLWLALSLNVGTLIYFKYANFLVENIQSIQSTLGMAPSTWQNVILPIGISFFTFQSITYIVDVYKEKHAPAKKPIDYFLYILSFPQMIAGPIVQYNLIADELTNRKESTDDFLDGFLRFAIGLGKKVLIANILAEDVDLILGDYADTSTTTMWFVMVAYSFQIYFDFSGYSDMAVGLGKMVGFHFPENFNNPYTSKNISEFWRKWHITLGSWMKNYIYIPLGGNRVGSKYRSYINLSIVFFISGLWHGASWNFVLWGIFHGAFLILDRLFLVNVLKKLGQPFSILFTFLVVTLAWVLFRMETLPEALDVYKILFGFTENIQNIPFSNSAITIFGIALFFAGFTLLPFGKRIQDYFFGGNTRTLGATLALATLTVLLLLLSIAFLSPGGINPFIYTRF